MVAPFFGIGACDVDCESSKCERGKWSKGRRTSEEDLEVLARAAPAGQRKRRRHGCRVPSLSGSCIVCEKRCGNNGSEA